MPAKLETDQISRVEAAPDERAVRLDRWLAERIDHLSRSRIQALVRAGAVTIDAPGGGTIGDVTECVKPGAAYLVRVPRAEDSRLEGEAIALDVVYEDDHLIVIDKPSGLVVHPAAGHASGTLVNALVAHCGDSLSGIGGVRRPGIVHRLDKDTSGLLVVAKNDAAHVSLSEQFRSHGRDGRLHRAYQAIAWGAPTRPAGVIDAPLSRSISNRTKIAVVRQGIGREAITHYEIVERFGGSELGSAAAEPVASLLRLVLETGRTHQIRVHLAHNGHPVLGDRIYGAGFRTRANRLDGQARRIAEALPRQALHAAELGFEHPVSGERLNFVSQLPGDMAELLKALRDGKIATGATEKRRADRSKER